MIGEEIKAFDDGKQYSLGKQYILMGCISNQELQCVQRKRRYVNKESQSSDLTLDPATWALLHSHDVKHWHCYG